MFSMEMMPSWRGTEHEGLDQESASEEIALSLASEGFSLDSSSVGSFIEKIEILLNLMNQNCPV